MAQLVAQSSAVSRASRLLGSQLNAVKSRAVITMTNESDAATTNRSVAFIPLLGAALGLSIASLAAVLRASRPPMEWPEAVEVFAGGYATGVSVTLYVERYCRAAALGSYRIIESSGAGVGFATVLALVWAFASGRPLADPALDLCSAIAAAALLIRERTDRVRALVLILMAIAVFHWPPVSVHFPFISLSIFWVVLAVGCLTGGHGHRTAVHRLFSVGVLTNLIVAAFGVYALRLAYTVGSPLGLLLGGAMLILGTMGTAVIVLRGPWLEQHV